MALYDGTNAPIIKVYLDTGSRNQEKFILNYSLLGGSDLLGTYTPFTTLTQLPTTDVKQINIRRGRTREDQQVQPGQLTFTLDNTSGSYDPELIKSALITAASGNGTTVTYTSNHNLNVGDIVTVLNLTATALNLKLQTVTTVSATEFTVSNTATGSCTGQTTAAYFSGYVNTTVQNFLTASTGVRVTATMSGGTERNLFTGFIEQIDKDLSLEPTVTITCVDALAQLGRRRTNVNVNTLGDGDAVAKILTDIGWQGTLDGSANNFTVSSVPTGDALQMIDQITSTQLGLFRIDSNGDAIWNGGDVFETGSFAGAFKYFTMTDARTSNDVVEYDSISVIGGEKYMRNTINATNTRTDGVVTTFTKFNSAGAGRFGSIPASVNLFFAAADASTAAQNLADQFANPQYRVDQISFECVGFSSALWDNILLADLGVAVIVKRTPIYTTEKTYNCWIQQLNHDITPNTWRMSLTLSPAT